MPSRPLLAFASLCFLPALHACGPFFPNCYLGASYAEQSELPTLGFDAELQRILSPAEAAARQGEFLAQDDPAETRAELAEARTYEPSLAAYDRENPPPGLPAEFQLYAVGALAWHHHELLTAADAWRRLLALPPTQRRHRSVWAAYMLGRLAAAHHPGEAEGYWQQTRELAATGFADSRHLAIASLGESALLALNHASPNGALRLYWQQYLGGGHTARVSLQFTLRSVFLNPTEPEAATLEAFAANAVSRRIVTAWFVSRGGPYQTWSGHEESRFKSWLEAVSRQPPLPAPEADRWAWASYAAGEWDAAARFAEAAPADAPASEWVRALLLLRRGYLDQAAVHLANAARAFQPDGAQRPLAGESDAAESVPPADSDGNGGFIGVDPHAKLEGIRGCLALSRDHYVEALRLFVAAHHDLDAAYVAEKVLTMTELRTFVDTEAGPASDLRSVLARRLARDGRFADARPYYPASVRPAFDAYVRAAARGYDGGLPRSDRVAAFWTAAQVLHSQGMEILGTDHEPDFALTNGDFEWPVLASNRREHAGGGPWYFAPGAPRVVADPLEPTLGEQMRYARAKTPSHHYHYRYRAAELAMLAAELSPDDDPTTATILATAGNWLAPRDPESAQIFYKTLVIRCPDTELGRKAAAVHWLPKS